MTSIEEFFMGKKIRMKCKIAENEVNLNIVATEESKDHKEVKGTPKNLKLSLKTVKKWHCKTLDK